MRRRTSPSRKAYIEMSQYQNDSSVSAHSKRVSYIAMGCLILLGPIIIVCLWHTIVNLDGLALNMWEFWKTYNLEGVRIIWPMPSFYACKLIFTFTVFEALLQVYVPGERHIGVISPAGNRPVYKKNGVICCVITLFVFYSAHKQAYTFQNISSSESAVDGNPRGKNISILRGCMITLVRSIRRSSSSALLWFAWSFLKATLTPHRGILLSTFTGFGPKVFSSICLKGLELYPRIGKDFDLKLYFISRFGMMSWACLIIGFAFKQLTYIFKFFWWEGGFLNTLSMMHDRARFYSTWGAMVWLPAVYPSPVLYLVNHPVQLGIYIAAYILFAGIICIYTQYAIDYQRHEFRETHAKARVWGIMPVEIQAHYVTEKGEHKQTILLATGWWGLARHIHYAFEIMGYFFWSVPALFNHASPYFFLLFLMLFLLDRVERDDKRCKVKYMKFWDQYRKKVPNKMIPLIY